MTLGLYYLMFDPLYIPEEHGQKTKVFRNTEEVLLALHASGSYNWYEKESKKRKSRRSMDAVFAFMKRSKLRTRRWHH